MTTILNLVKKFDAQYFDKINLVASENLSSENLRYVLQSDLHHRYVIPGIKDRDPAIWEYPNQDIPREIVQKTHELCCDIFHGNHADSTPLSGNQVAMIMLTCLLEAGDSFLSVGGADGGHFTTEKLARRYGFNRLNIPYNGNTMDVEKTAHLAKEHQAKLIFLDASMIQFPYPLRALRDAVGEDVIISYDASHTLGIIAGKGFQSPLEEGADFLHGSTHKSLWGGQKAVIISAHKKDHPLSQKVFSRIVPEFVSNAHPHHIAALGIALEESRDFGEDYARDVVINARLFAMEATRRGLKVLGRKQGFTENHQLIIDMGDKESAELAFTRLNAIGIHVNQITIPHTDGKKQGLRLGFSEVTRRGMYDSSIIDLANLTADTIFGTQSLQNIQKHVKALSSAHRSILYAHPPKQEKAPLLRKQDG